MEHELTRAHERVTLLELVDRVLDKGVVISGDITLSVASVDLVYVGLRALLASVASLEEEARAPGASTRVGEAREGRGLSEPERAHASPLRDH